MLPYKSYLLRAASIAVFLHGLALAQSVSLSTSTATGTPGSTVGITISLATSGGAQPAALEWTIGYSTTDITAVSVTATGSAATANKTVICANGTGTTICILYGMNQTAIGAGAIAQVMLTLSSTTTDSSTNISVTQPMAADANGGSIPATASGAQVSIGRLSANSVTPNSGSGSTQSFSFVFSDAFGASDLSAVQVIVNAVFTGAQACYLSVDVVHSAAYLVNDAGNGLLSPVTLGAANSASNSQCAFNGTGSSLVASGNTLTLNLSFTFQSAFAGSKNVYGYGVDAAGISTGWQTLGSWTVPGTTVSAVSMTPASGTGSTQTFAFAFSDTAGASSLNTVQVLLNSAFTGMQACYIWFDVTHSAAYLVNDASSASLGPLTLGTANSLSNSQCTLNGTGSSVVTSGNTLTLNLAITFQPGFAGAKNAYGDAMAAGGINSGWQTLGSWTVPGTTASAVSVTPASGTGSTQTFAFAFSDTAGASSLSTVQVLLNSAFTGIQSCYIWFDVTHSAAYLVNDASSSSLGPLTLGTANSLSNSQCTLNGTGSSLVASGNTLTLNLAITFQSGFAGTKNVYGDAMAAGGINSGWQTLGSWTVPGGSASVVSVTPASGSGRSQTFSFVFSDTAGASSFNTAQVLINSAFTGVQACYVWFDVVHSAAYLVNDASSGSAGPLTLGSSSSLSNSQCTLNGTGSSAVASGNTLTLNLAIRFKTSFLGSKSVYADAIAAGGIDSGWQTLGSWTVQ